MYSEQELRGAAAQAAATLMAPAQPSPADFIGIAEVIAAFIRDGSGAALALCGAVAPAPQTALEPVPQVIPIISALPGILSIDVTDEVPAKQENARRIIEQTRRKRVDALMAQAGVAKVKGHLRKLLDEAEETSLDGYPVVVDGETTTLGSYLTKLYEH